MGPFLDYLGENMSDTTNNYPVIAAPYQFNNHPGWAGTGHCGVVGTDNGKYFMVHQGRLSPGNHLMVLHVRQLFFTPDGWPVASPQRYVEGIGEVVSEKKIAGEWEMIRIRESVYERELEAGQILWGEGELHEKEWNKSFHINLNSDGSTSNNGSWSFEGQNQTLTLTIGEENIRNLYLFFGQDWENQTQTLLFTGLDDKGRSVWGKRTK